ncbi:MAG: Uma2 family endonuclease [Myxococcota bacterium]
MPAESASRLRMTREDYLAMERASDTKHELWDGEVFAMVGASYAHNVVKDTLARLLGNLLDARGCRVLTSDMRVRIPSGKRYVYPDVVVLCGAPQLEDDHGDVLCNPQVLVEVLSPSTAAFDRGAKFDGYRSIPSQQEYVLVSPEERKVDHFTRADDPGAWIFRAFGVEDALPFPTLGVHVPLREVFAGVVPP